MIWNNSSWKGPKIDQAVAFNTLVISIHKLGKETCSWWSMHQLWPCKKTQSTFLTRLLLLIWSILNVFPKLTLQWNTTKAPCPTTTKSSQLLKRKTKYYRKQKSLNSRKINFSWSSYKRKSNHSIRRMRRSKQLLWKERRRSNSNSSSWENSYRKTWMIFPCNLLAKLKILSLQLKTRTWCQRTLISMGLNKFNRTEGWQGLTRESVSWQRCTSKTTRMWRICSANMFKIGIKCTLTKMVKYRIE